MSNTLLQSKSHAEEGNFLISEEIVNERTKVTSKFFIKKKNNFQK